MPDVTRSRTVAAPPDQVWELVSDPFNLPRWWPATARVEDVDDDAWTSVLRTPSGKTVRADFTRVERAISRIAIRGSGQDFVGVTHEKYRGVRARLYNRSSAHGVIVLSIHPVF